MRLDWNLALIMNRGAPVQVAGYSDVTLRSNGTVEAVDYPLGLASRTWTARKLRTHNLELPMPPAAERAWDTSLNGE